MKRCPPEECRRTWRVVQSQDKVEGNLLPDRNQTTLEHKTERYLSDGHWLGDFESSFIFVSNFRLYKEANLGWHNPSFALNWPWYNPSLKGHALEQLYLTFLQGLQQIENQDLCEWECGLDLEGDKFCPLLNHHLQLLRIANLTDVKMKISPQKMKLTLSPFASRIRSPGLSRPCLSMNESMMILATITWKHFLKNSFSKKQKSEAAKLTLSKCAGLVSIPHHLHDIIWYLLHNQKIFLFVLMDSAQQVGFSNTGSGRVWGKIPGSRLDLGRVVVLKYTIRYFRVFLYLQVCLGILGI